MQTGIEQLRSAVTLLNYCREAFCQRYSAEELLTFFRMYVECDRFITPDDWTEQQRTEALAGKVPQWDSDDRPVYSVPVVETQTSDTLLPGTYRLACDIVNPKPDRRSKHDWRDLQTIKSGTVFCVSPSNTTEGSYMTIWAQSESSHQDVYPHSELYKLLVPCLVRIDEEPSDMLMRKGWRHQGHNVLDRLYRDGVITMAQVESALQAWLDEAEG